jgi:nitrite reductase (NO-forming)
MIAGGVVIPQTSFAPDHPLTDAERLDLGRDTFARICAACHQAQGQGTPGVFPPLAQSDYLAKTAKPTIIGHVVRGLQGPIDVAGRSYNGVMPPLGFLSDEEIAGALSFVRSSWGNKLDAVTPAEVARVRNQQAVSP